MKPGLPDVDIDSTIFRPATFIEMSIDNLTMSLDHRLRAVGLRAVLLPVRMAGGADQLHGDAAVDHGVPDLSCTIAGRRSTR